MSEKATRMLRIYERLQRGPVTISSLKNWAANNEINISERTLYRDLIELQEISLLKGEKIVEYIGEKNKKTWKIEFKESTDLLTEFDIHSFLLVQNFTLLVILNTRRKSFDKLIDTVFQNYSKSKFERNDMLFHTKISTTNFYEFPYSDTYNKILEDCIWSIQNERKIYIENIQFDYTSISPAVKFPVKLQPLQLIYHRGAIHLAGILSSSKKVIVLALEQINGYNLTNEHFKGSKLWPVFLKQMNNRFGITENMNTKIYNVKLEFSKVTGSFVKNHYWHNSQKITQLNDGNYLVELTCGINRELVGWIFQWMNNCKVIKPLFLKKIVQFEIDQMKEIYKNPRKLNYTNIFKKK